MQKTKQNTNSVIGSECHKDWKLVEHEGKQYFSNPKYKNKKYKIGVIQEFDKKEQNIKKKLYPISDIEHDQYNICFNINCNQLIPNKFQDFSSSRRGKRLTKYISYREMREQTKKENELLNPKLKISNTIR